jgi:hypothetical protein
MSSRIEELEVSVELHQGRAAKTMDALSAKKK